MEITLVEVDLRKGNGHHHPDIQIGVPYLAYIEMHIGEPPIYYTGEFDEEWYGLNFNVNGGHHFQYDQPGTNNSPWVKLWKIV